MGDYSNNIRPNKISEILGQKHLIKFLNKLVEKKHVTSLLLFGKSGIGKTSIAYALCKEWKISFSYFNSARGTKKELENHISISDVIIIDEIHRLNKDKQDILLPVLERERISVIATTTENPYFTVIPALRSRMHVLELVPLETNDITQGLWNIVKKKIIDVNITKALVKKIAIIANGDFRFAINSLNLIYRLYKKAKITEKIIKIVLSSPHFYSDKNSVAHYDLLSAFHKSLRGSNIDASLYYLALLIKTGDLIGMERRMLMATYEDIGLANPNLTLRITSALENAKKVGFPEAGIILSYAVIEICKSNKSNSSVVARNNALNLVEKEGFLDIPKHLKDANYKSAKKLGSGIGYKYPHNYGGFVKQQYLNEKIKNKKIFKPNKNDKI